MNGSMGLAEAFYDVLVNETKVEAAGVDVSNPLVWCLHQVCRQKNFALVARGLDCVYKISISSESEEQPHPETVLLLLHRS